MNYTKEIEAHAERLRRWKEEHECLVDRYVIRSGFLQCSCGFGQAVDGIDAANRARTEHLRVTMPELDFLSSQVGHWLFVRSPKDKKGETWICHCSLCGFEAKRVDRFGTLRPLTGNLSRVRRAHDKEKHPDKLVEQRNDENAILAKTSHRSGALRFKVGERGGVSVYGLGRFPVTLYYEQWVRLLDTADGLRAFLEENKGRLKFKGVG